jgi:histidinol-phosphatase (PHP family)
MVLAGLEKGFSVLGFSAHGMYPFSSDWQMPIQSYTAYVAEVQRLAREYNNRIEILVGFEADWFPPLSSPDRRIYSPLGAQFLIGSVHYLSTDEGNRRAHRQNPQTTPDSYTGLPFTCFTVDGPETEVATGIASVFGGDGKRAVQAYFSAQRDMLASAQFDILGHCDIIRKRNGVLRFFDETESWYRRELEATAQAAAQAGTVVELNTGGIARGAIDDIYPSAEFLKILHSHDVPVIINSDAHCSKDLDCCFNRAAGAAKKAGYSETVFLSQGKWQNSPLY